MSTQLDRPGIRGIEAHSIDFIALSERHGKPRDLFTLWFGANMVLISVATGAILVAAGVGFVWSALGIVIGLSLGTIIAALHSAQGPTLGIPQMVQSRAQFGYIGGILPMLVAEVAYFGFFAANPAIGALVLTALWGLPVWPTVLVLTVLMFGVALWGYDFSHRMGKYMAVLAIAAFGLFTVLLLFHNSIAHPTYSNLSGGFSLGPFLFAIAICFVYNGGYAPYVADYSRYLPETVSAKSTGLWSYAGITISGIWLFLIGAYLASITGFGPDIIGSALTVAGGVGPWFKYVFSIIVVLVLILQGSLSMYAGANTGISIINALRPGFADIKASVRIRAMALIVVGVVCFWVGLAYTGNFGTVFGDTLSVILILLIPWSAVNLTDFYFVRKGHYVTAEIFKPDGIYGRFNTAGFVSFFLALACELVFTNLGFYVSPVANLLSGGDLSWLVGVIVAGGSYLLLAPRFGSGEVPRSGVEQVTSSSGL